MSEAARLDYFRSEFEGKLAQIRKEATESENRLSNRLKVVEDSLDKARRDLKEALLYK